MLAFIFPIKIIIKTCLLNNDDRRGQMTEAHFMHIEVLVKDDIIIEW